MGESSNFKGSFEPAIAGFFCQVCGDDCLVDSGEHNGEFPNSLKSVRLICAEKVGPDLIRQAFEVGADGVLICGCLVGNCQSLDGNAQVLQHIHQSKMALRELGIPQGRLRQEWVCAEGGDCVRKIVEEFTEQIRALGPVEIPVAGDLQKTP